MGQPLLPDVPNWSWHEYGMRVGFWRIFDALVQRNIVPTLATNGIVCESYPRVVESTLKHGWEMMGHSYVQGPMHKLPNQLESIEKQLKPLKTLLVRRRLVGKVQGSPKMKKRLITYQKPAFSMLLIGL